MAHLRPEQLEVTLGSTDNTTVTTKGYVDEKSDSIDFWDRIIGGTTYLIPGISSSDEIGATAERITKGWFTNLEVTNMPTVNGTSINSNGVLDLASGEVTQLANIDATVISTSQWAYVGDMDQSVASTDDVNFASVETSGNLVFNGELTNDSIPTSLNSYVRFYGDTSGSGTLDTNQQAGSLNTTGITTFWQSFTVESSGLLTKIDCYFPFSINNNTLKIYLGEGTAGTLLYTSPLLGVGTGGLWLEHTLTTPITVSNGTQYTYQWSGALTNTRREPGNVYPGGMYSGNATEDLMFRIYINSAFSFFYFDADTDRFGFNTFSPATLVDINGSATIDTLTLGAGGSINEIVTSISTPTNNQIPTAAAVETYVTNSNTNNMWNRLGGGSEVVTRGGVYTVTIGAGATGIDYVLGFNGENNDAAFTWLEDEAILNFDNAFSLASGTSVNEFSIDGTLAGNSDDAVPTEKAVKTYVDQKVINEYNSSDTITADTAATYQQKVRLTTSSLPAGTYSIFWSCELSISDDKSNINTRVQIDDTTTISEQSGRVVQLDTYNIRSGFIRTTLTAGIHTIDLDYSNDESKTLSIRRARIELNRR